MVRLSTSSDADAEQSLQAVDQQTTFRCLQVHEANFNKSAANRAAVVDAAGLCREGFDAICDGMRSQKVPQFKSLMFVREHLTLGPQLMARWRTHVTAVMARLNSRSRWALGFVVCCSLFVLVNDRPAAAVDLVAGNGDNEETENPQQLPFMLPAQPTEVQEALEDFRRYAGRKQWEKAFKHLEKVFNASANGLVLTSSGIMLPSRMIAREALLEMPPAGQDAYRLFFDAEAKKLYEQAKEGDELNKLTLIVNRYLVTSVGDEAANRLGDLHFEAGNFAQAVNAWREILEERPDSRIPKARLRMKIAVGLARQRQWGAFRELQKLVESQHSRDKVTVGGREVPVVEYLREVASRRPKETAETSAIVTTYDARSSQMNREFTLAHNPEPLWQMRFFLPKDEKDPNSTPGLKMQQNMWWGGGAPSASDYVPRVASDQQRTYAHFVGYDLAVDAKQGKIAWRSGRFLDAGQKAQQGQLGSLEQYGFGLNGGKTWAVVPPADGQNQNNRRMMMMMGQGGGGQGHYLVARDAATGKQVLTTREIAELRELSFRSDPLFADDRIFLCASKTNNANELVAVCLNAADGRLIWATSLGSYINMQRWWYYGQMERETQPSLLFHEGRLYLDTHAGSLVRLEPVTGQVDWGFNYQSEMNQQGGRFFFGYPQPTEILTVSPPQIIDGVLYVKGMKSSKLYAIDPQRPKLLWSRPIPKTSVVIGADDQRLYLGGDEITAIDLATRKMQWSVRANLGSGWSRPLLSKRRVHAFSTRGILEIDSATGRVVHLFRGHDLESLGGELILLPESLLAVSNLAITAYPIQPLPVGTTAQK